MLLFSEQSMRSKARVLAIIGVLPSYAREEGDIICKVIEGRSEPLVLVEAAQL
jgi:hypothetical protein